MKKIKYLLVLLLFVFSTTGCVRMHADMEIKANKEMTYKVIYAVDTSVFGDTEAVDEDQLAEIKKNGFEVEKYKDGNYSGYVFTKKIKNIDDVSTTKKIDAALLGGLDEAEDESEYLFTVKKGLLKNTYTANFTFDSSAYDMDADDDDDYDYDEDYDFDDEDYSFDDIDFSDEEAADFSADTTEAKSMTSIDDDYDFSSMYKNLDVKYTVTLPYGAKSSNATSKDGKKLTWNLFDSDFNGVKYEFDVYNLPVVIGLGVGILAIIGGTIFFIIKKKKGNGTKSETVQNAQTAAPVTPVQTEPAQPTTAPVQATTEPVPAAEAPATAVTIADPTPVETPAVEPTPVAEQPAVETPVVNNEPAPAVETPIVNNEPTPAVETPVVNNEPTPLVNNDNNIS